MKYIFISVFFHLAAAISLKYAALEMTEFSISSIFTNFLYVLSVFLLFLQALSWQKSLSFFDLNYAYSYKSVYYPLLLISTYFIFDEEITLGNVIGTVVIFTSLIIPKNILSV